MEKTYLENEQMFKGLFEHAPHALLVIDHQGKILHANQQSKKMFGYSSQEMIGQSFERLFAASSHIGRLAFAPDSKSSDDGNTYAVLGQRKDGSQLSLALILTPFEDHQEAVTLVTMHDDARLMQVEKVLQEQEKLLSLAVMSESVYFFKVDREGIVRFSMGQNLAKFLQVVDPVGKSVRELFANFPQIPENIDRAFNGEVFTIQIDVNDLTFEITCMPVKDQFGEVDRVVAAAVDVTSPRLMGEALRKSEERFHTIFNDAVLGIKLIDLEGRIVESNPALQEMLGYTAEELRQLTILDITHPSDLPKMQTLLLDLVAGRIEHFRTEKRYIRKDGQVVWGRLAMSLFRSGNGMPSYAIGMIENNTYQKMMEAELAEIQRRLSDSVENERLHLSQELHDGPLQDLQAMTYQIALLESYIQDAEGAEELEGLTGEVKRVAQALRTICGELRPPALTPFGLEKAVRSHAEHFREQNPTVELKLDLMDDNTLLSERVRLALFRIYQQAIANIVRHSNATQVTIRFMFDRQKIQLQVEDNGRGFQLPDRWIELARQGHFGLVGAIERAESVGGNLQIKSRPGKGTLISVSVPRREEEQIAPRERIHLTSGVK